MTEVIAIFDIGKTNKKVLLFNKDLKIVYQEEQKFSEIEDEDGFPCDDIQLIEEWIKKTISELATNPQYKIKAVNFSTYGATLMFIDEEGNPVTPLYNYLKPMPEEITNAFYNRHGGMQEFSRITASPALGFLNSGLQILWLKKHKPEVFARVKHILHFPQYCSYLLGKEVVSEYTSIGCHTAMWDFDNMHYHDWLSAEDIHLPDPIANTKTFNIVNGLPDKKNTDNPGIVTGTGIHDSSASLAPYIISSKNKFILLSTGTWCINMNPYNYEPLTKEELQNDCLSYLSIAQKPVKSSRLFMGHMHDVNLENLNTHFNVDSSEFKKVRYNPTLAEKILENEMIFFANGIPENYIDETINYSSFDSFEVAYHQLMIDLTLLNKKSIDLVIPEKDTIECIYISGGFARNEIFGRCLAKLYSNKKVYTSEIDNATALGAALVVYKSFGQNSQPMPDLGLQRWNP